MHLRAYTTAHYSHNYIYIYTHVYINKKAVAHIKTKLTQTHKMDRDELRTCPYDKNHQVRSSRFEIHLIKCKRNNDQKISKKITVEVCPFNVKHQYTKDEMRLHLRDCPDKYRLITEKIYMEMPPPEREIDTPAAFDCEEDWDKKEESAQPKNSEPRINPAFSYARLSKKGRKDAQEQWIKDFKTKQREKEELEKKELKLNSQTSSNSSENDVEYEPKERNFRQGWGHLRCP